MLRSATAPAIVVVISLLAAGCGSDSGTSPSSTASAPYSQTDLRVGTGAEAVAGRGATVHYTLWLYDAGRAENKGAQIETSVGGAPFTFTVGARQVISGWDRGVPGMRVGGLRRLVIPPDLAYGSQANGRIPGNSTLVFDIELLAVQ
jgi:FKBP-type peptidyl-prolyl cis-trans isomerase FkpA